MTPTEVDALREQDMASPEVLAASRAFDVTQLDAAYAIASMELDGYTVVSTDYAAEQRKVAERLAAALRLTRNCDWNDPAAVSHALDAGWDALAAYTETEERDDE